VSQELNTKSTAERELEMERSITKMAKEHRVIEEGLAENLGGLKRELFGRTRRIFTQDMYEESVLSVPIKNQRR